MSTRERNDALAEDVLFVEDGKSYRGEAIESFVKNALVMQGLG